MCGISASTWKKKQPFTASALLHFPCLSTIKPLNHHHQHHHHQPVSSLAYSEQMLCFPLKHLHFVCACVFFSSFSLAHRFVADFHSPISNRSERGKRGGNIPTLIMCLIRGFLHPDAFISRNTRTVQQKTKRCG